MISEVEYTPEKTIAANGIEINFDTFGNPSHPALVLIMGLGMQMIGWDNEFCARLAALDLYVIRFDNRDMGYTTWFDGGAVPNAREMLGMGLFGRKFTPSYHLTDMADDVIGLLDALNIEKAHLFGISMGGMIAQLVTIRHQHRVLTLTSFMSTTGEKDLPLPTIGAMKMLLTPPPTEREAALQQSVKNTHLLSGSNYIETAERIRDFYQRSVDRNPNPAGVGRQVAAILTASGRREALQSVNVPALVLHGDEDPLVPLAAGIDTALALPNCRFRIIEGLGHVMPRKVWPLIIEEIGRITAKAPRPEPIISAESTPSSQIVAEVI